MALIHHAFPLHPSDLPAAVDYPRLFLPPDPVLAAWEDPGEHLAVDRTWLALRRLLRGTPAAALFAPGIPDRPTSRGACGVVTAASVRNAHELVGHLASGGLPLDDLTQGFAPDHVVAHARQAERVLAGWARRGDGAVWLLLAAQPLPLPTELGSRILFPLAGLRKTTDEPRPSLAA